MDNPLQDAEAAERIAGLMLDDTRNEWLATCIYDAQHKFTTLKILQNVPWPNTVTILSYSDALDALYGEIADIVGFTRHEAQRMIEGKDFRAAELAALRIGRGVLDRLGYADTEPQKETKDTMGQTLTDLLKDEYARLLVESGDKRDAARNAAIVHDAAGREEAACLDRMQAVARTLNTYGMGDHVDAIYAAYQKEKANV